MFGERNAEKLKMIEGAIAEIRGRRDLSDEAKRRGVRALERARARLEQDPQAFARRAGEP